jgi:methionyl-tRNA formyltransferase
LIYDSIILIGTGKVALECLKECLKKTNNIIYVEPELDTFSPIKHFCYKKGIEIIKYSRKENIISFFNSVKVNSLVISAHNIFIFPYSIIAKQNLKIINFHNSFLPDYKGRNIPSWVIFNMEKYTGVTWHEITEDIDSGNIIAQERILIPSNITAIKLTELCALKGIDLFIKIFPSIYNNSFENKKQKKGLYRFYKSTEIPNKGFIDLSWSLNKISSFLRALDYGPYKVFPNPIVNFMEVSYEVKAYEIIFEENNNDSYIKIYNNILELSKDNLIIKLNVKVIE